MSNRLNKKDRKNHIMNIALQTFAEKGFQNATISEISKAAGVSDATVYEYFGTKEKLLFSIPEKISDDSYDELQQVLPYIKEVEGRVRAVLLMFIRLYESNPDYSNLMLLQLMSNKDFRNTAAHAAVRKSARLLLDTLQQGISEGVFRKETNPYLIRSMLMGAVEHLFIHWHMQGRPERENKMTDFLEPIMDTIFEGIRIKKLKNSITLNLKVEDGDVIKSLLSGGQTLIEPSPE